MRSLGIGHLIEEGKVRRTILAALQDAGVATPGTSMESEESSVIQMPWQLEIPAAVHAVHEAMIPAEEENTLEEFAWAFGDDAVEEMEKKVHQVMEQIHRLPDLERLADVGFEEKLKNWHSLGALDEDEILRRMERPDLENFRNCSGISQRRAKKSAGCQWYLVWERCCCFAWQEK